MTWRGIRSALSETVPPLLAMLCAILATLPLFRAGFPLTHDGQSHLLRLAGFAVSVDHGAFYPRWSEALDLSYGSPVFAFYAPLSYYAAELVHLAGQDLLDSLRWVFVSGIVLSGFSMYLLGRELAGRAAGFASGTAYALLPYQLHDVYIRGALAEAFALWLLPLTLFGYTRYARTGQTIWLGIGALYLGAIVLTHNITALMFFPFLLLWILLLWIVGPPFVRSESVLRRAPLLPMLAAVVLGLGLAAFFWLPALTERGSVMIQKMVANYDVRAAFNHVRPPVEPSWLFDYRYDPVQHPVRPGLVQVLLACFGALVFVMRRARRNNVRSICWIAPWLLMAPFLLFLQYPASTLFWESVPLVTYLEFPYRLMALFGLITALLTGFVTCWLRNAALRALLAAAVVILASVAGLAQLHPDYVSGVLPGYDARAILMTEAARGNLSGATDSEYTPRWVTAPIDEVIASVGRGSTTLRDLPEVPLHASVVRSEETSTELLVDAEQPSTLLLRRFYMPGWTAEENGKPLRVHPVGPLGLVAVELPAGTEQHVHLWYARTPIEFAALFVTVASGVGLAAWIIVTNVSDRRRLGLALGCVTVSALAIGLLLRLWSHGPAQPMLSVPRMTLAPGYELAGAQIDPSLAATQGTVRLTLYILTLRAGSDLRFQVRAQDDGGATIADVTMRPWNGPTTTWEPGELAPALLDLELPGGATPGHLNLSVTVYDAKLPTVALATVALPAVTVAVTPAHRTHVFATGFADNRTTSGAFADKMAIQRYEFDRAETNGIVRVGAGQTLRLTLDLQSTRWIGEDQTVFVHLLDSQGELRAQHDELAGGAAYPTSRWLPGTLVRQQFTLAVPLGTPDGVYRIEAGFYELATLKRLSLLDRSGKPIGDSAVFGTVHIGG